MGSPLALGGDRFPPGKYRVTVEFEDLISRESDSLTKTFRCIPAEFGMVPARFAADGDGRSPARVDGVVGQPLHLLLRAVPGPAR